MSDHRTALGGAVHGAPEEHCWHTYRVQTGLPPTALQRCCWCKAERSFSDDFDKHGPYA